MSTLPEQIAIQALRDIAKLDHAEASEAAKKALAKIDELNRPGVHHLGAQDVTVSPAGGGFTKG